MRRNLALVSLLAFLLLLTFANVRAQARPSGMSDEAARDLAVYHALLRHESLRRPSSANCVLLGCNATGGPQIVLVRDIEPASAEVPAGTLERMRRTLRTPEAGTMDAFVRVLGLGGRVPEQLATTEGVVLVDRAELDRRLRNEGGDYWRAFHRRYPQAAGLVTVSRVAYSDSGREAMAYVALTCDGWCGHGLTVVLQLVDGHWTMIEHMHVWLG